MGLGIIALGLWLLYGLKLSINEWQLLPTLISLLFILLGQIVILKRYKNKNILNSLYFTIIYFIIELINMFISLNSILKTIYLALSLFINILHLYYLLKGIVEIAQEYKYLEKDKKYFRIYFKVFIVINIISFIISFKTFKELSMIGSIIVIIFAIMTLPLSYKILFINKYLEDQNQPIIISKPIKRNNKNRIISIICIVISVIILIISNFVVPSINQMPLKKDVLFVSGESKNIKIEYAGICLTEDEKTLYTSVYSTGTLSPQIYMSNDLLSNIKSLDYQGYVSDNNLVPVIEKNNVSPFYHTYDNYYNIRFKRLDNDEENVSIDVFDNITSLEELKAIKENKKNIHITFNIIKKNNEEYQETVELKPIETKTYQYKDKNLSIDTLCVVDNFINSTPAYSISYKYIKEKNITSVKLIFGDNYTKTIELDDLEETITIDELNKYHINGGGLNFKKLKDNDMTLTIKSYHKNQLVDTYTVKLEEIP